VPLHATTQILGADEKRIYMFHALYETEGGTLLATGENMQLHVDTKQSRACPAAPEVVGKLKEIAAAQAELSAPEGAGRAIAMPAKRT